MNILITSVGRRTRLIESFKKEFTRNDKIIAADCNEFAPALYIADKHYIVPNIYHPDYITEIKRICEEQQITAILSLIDQELSVLAKNINDFKKLGVTIIVSPLEVCNLWIDKYSAFKFCKDNNFSYAKTFLSFSDFKDALNKNEVNFPIFIKPRNGSASLNVHKARNLGEAGLIFNYSKEKMIIQEFLQGRELGVDFYVDLVSRKVTSIFIKEKILMRAGETDKAKSINDVAVFNLVEEVVKKTELVGPVDMDIFEVHGKYYISEINPRFGGGYPMAHVCGLNFPRLIVNNLKGHANEVNIGNYKDNVYMMKHDSLIVIDQVQNG